MTRNEKKKAAAAALAAEVKKPFPLKWVILAAVLAVVAVTLVVYFVFFFHKPFSAIARSEKEAETVLLLDGETEVPYDLYRYFFLNLKENTDLTGLTKEEAYDLLHEKTLREIAALYATSSYAASLSVTAEDRNVQKMLDELLLLTRYGGESFGYTLSGFANMEAYKTFLAENHMTDAVYRMTLLSMALEYEAAGVFTTSAKDKVGLDRENDILPFFRDDTKARRMTFCYISYDQFQFEPNAKAYTKNRAIAVYNALVARADSESYIPLSDFTGIAIQNSAYQNATSIENGVYVGRYDSDTVYADVVDELFALEKGQMSGLIETDSGFFIVRRMEGDEAYLTNMENDVTLRNTYLSNHFYEEIAKESERLYATLTVCGSLADLAKDPEAVS